MISNINLINPIGQLSDGRPIYSPTVNANTRVDPRYNVVNEVQSIGESTYKTLTAQFTGRNVWGIGSTSPTPWARARTTRRSPTSCRCRATPAGPTRQPRPRPRAQRPRPAPHLQRQHRRPAADRRRSGITGAIVNDTIIGLAMQFASGVPINLRRTGRDQQRRHRERPAGACRATRSTCRPATTSTCGCRGSSRSAAPARAR